MATAVAKAAIPVATAREAAVPAPAPVAARAVTTAEMMAAAKAEMTATAMTIRQAALAGAENRRMTHAMRCEKARLFRFRLH